jgi:hypothetical protein
MSPTDWAEPQKDNPPTVWCFYQVSMAKALEWMIMKVFMSENRVVWARFIRAPRRIATCNRDAVVVACASFRDHEVVFPVNLVEVWTLWPHATCTPPNFFHFSDQFSRFDVNELEPNISTFSAYLPVVIYLSVFIEEKGRIDALSVKPYWVRPGSRGICRVDIEIASTPHVGSDHVEDTIVIPDGGGKYPMGRLSSF